MVYNIVFLLLFINISCASNNLHDCKTIKVNPKYDHYKSIILGDEFLYIIGTESTTGDFRTRNSVIYKCSSDSLSKSINLLNNGIAGENRFYTTTSTTDNIYLLNVTYFKKNLILPNSSILSAFNTQDQSLREIANFGNILVRNLFIEDEVTGYAFVGLTNYPKDDALLITKNGWISWDTLLTNRPIMNNSHMKKGHLYFQSLKRNNFDTSWIYSINTIDFSFDSTKFNLGIRDYHIENLSEYWLLGKKDHQTILQRYDGTKVEDIHLFSKDSMYFPIQLYKYGNFIAVLNSKRDMSMFGGFGGTISELQLSFDNGLTWEINNQFDDAYYIKPLSFYKDERLAAYIGGGRIRICNYK